MAESFSTKGDTAEWVRLVEGFDDEELVRTARDYLWLAEFGPEQGRKTFDKRRDSVVQVMRERGLLEELRELRRELGSKSR
jgi:hypothetical protein